MKQYIYNTSDVGYMDEEWINYDPKKATNEDVNEDKNIIKIKDEQKAEEIQ
jgi:hypothetical protein